MLGVSLYRRFGSWLPGAELFDCAAFGMLAAEATVVDPQQRLTMEAMAAVLPSGRGGSAGADKYQPCGVFIGISSMDYARLTERHGQNSTPLSATGVLRASKLSLQAIASLLLAVLARNRGFSSLHGLCAHGRHGPQRCGWARGVHLWLARPGCGNRYCLLLWAGGGPYSNREPAHEAVQVTPPSPCLERSLAYH